jgi:transposase-like protein
MYLQGVSTGKVRAVTETLCEQGFSASLVSELTQQLDAPIQVWRHRPLTQAYPYLMVDARYEYVRVDQRVQSWGVLIVKGVGENGHREILSVESGNSENETTWAQVFQQLWEQGLRGVIYGVFDEHQGLRAAVARYFQGLGWQRCQVHYQRNAQQQVPLRERSVLAARLRDVFNAPDLATAQQRLGQVIGQYRQTHPKLADWLELTGEEALTVFTLPPAHRGKLRSTNGLEAFNGTIARRTRVVRIFPNEASCVRLVSALAMEQTETWLTGPKYLDMTALAEWTEPTTKELIAA